MIELSWKNCDSFVTITNLLSWLATTIEEMQTKQKVQYNGIIAVKDIDGKFTTLITMPDSESQKIILNLLLQPPGEFKEKYIACVPSEEPELVQEKKKNTSAVNSSDSDSDSEVCENEIELEITDSDESEKT